MTEKERKAYFDNELNWRPLAATHFVRIHILQFKSLTLYRLQTIEERYVWEARNSGAPQYEQEWQTIRYMTTAKHTDGYMSISKTDCYELMKEEDKRR